MSDVVSFARYANAPAAVERQMPSNVEAEQALLGAVLVNNQAWHAIGQTIASEHFVEEMHRRIWDVASALIREGKVADPITLRTWLGEHDLGAGMTVPMYLAQLAREATTVINAPDYARMVADLAERRQVITATQETLARAFDAPVTYPVDRLLDDALASIHAIADGRPRSGDACDVGGTLDDLIRQAEERLEGKELAVAATGLADIDRTLGGGLRPGRLIIVAGRPGMGKTVLLTALARRTAQKGAGVAVFSLEIDRMEFMARLAANAAATGAYPMDYRDILTGALDVAQIERLRAARQWLGKLPIAVVERGGLSMAQIEASAVKIGKRLARNSLSLGVICIDYLQLIQVTDRYKGKQVDELGEVVLAAKNMARRLGVCVVLLSQLNRGVESRDSKRPTMADLRGSGNIEEHADAVGLLYRPGYYDRHNPKLGNDPDFDAMADARKNLLEVIWDKNRLGPPGIDKLFCDVARSQVDSMARHKMGGA